MDPALKTARKQARAKARRRSRKNESMRQRRLEKSLTDTYKPLEEWDEEELARGRPRAADGTFRGPAPKYITRAVHEEAISRFKDQSQARLRGIVPLSLETVEMLLRSEETDDRGRPLVPAGVKLDAAKWAVEHLVGKPTQRTELDISVKLQSILGQVMVTPDEAGELGPAMDVESWETGD